MSKLFWSTLLITSVATSFGFITIARSQTAPTSNTLSQFPVAPNPQVEPPVCFFTSKGGRTFDLESLCGASSVNPNDNSATSNDSADGANTPENAPLNAPNNNLPSDDTPSNNSPVINSPSQTDGDADLGPLTKPAINLPNVPPSALSPSGVAPTRESIDGNNQK
ncbi:MAG: hypothetical protein ACRC2J_15225 [Microcoleaceae cyanobacterium]